MSLAQPFERCVSLAQPFDRCVSLAQPFDRCVSLVQPFERCVSLVQPFERCVSLAQPFDRCVSLAQPFDRCVSLVQPFDRCVSLAQPFDRYVSLAQPFDRCVSLAKCVTFKALGMCGLLTRNSGVWFLQKTKSMPKGCPALGAFYDTCMETQNWSLQVSLGIPHIYPSSCFLKMQCSWGHLHQLDCLSRDPLWSIGHSDPRINLSA